jgi:hypothetical protein
MVVWQAYLPYLFPLLTISLTSLNIACPLLPCMQLERI